MDFYGTTFFKTPDFDTPNLFLRLYGIPIGAVFEAFSDVLAAVGSVFPLFSMHQKERLF